MKLVTKAKEDPKIIAPSVNQVPKTANKPIKNGIVTVESLQAELAEQKVCENWKTFCNMVIYRLIMNEDFWSQSAEFKSWRRCCVVRRTDTEIVEKIAERIMSCLLI